MEALDGPLLTMAQIVGMNARAAREERGWTRKELLGELDRHAFRMSKATLERFESGESSTWGYYFIPIGLALGVAPLVLLMPPAGSTIAIDRGRPLSDEYSILGDALPGHEEALEVRGALLAHGPWEEDWNPGDLSREPGLVAVKAWERAWWEQASNVGRSLTADEQAHWDRGEKERQRRLRLIDALIETLPSKIRSQLAEADGSWFESGIADAWYLPAWSTEKLAERAEQLGLEVPPQEEASDPSP